MPATFTTVNQSIQLSDAGTSGNHAISLTRRVVSDTPLDITVGADFAQLQAHLGLPLKLLNAWSTTTLMGTMRLRQTQVVPHMGGKGKIFDVTQQFDTMYRWTNVAAGGGTDQYVLPITVAYEYGERPVQVYRNQTFGTQPSANANTTSDIGGSAVDRSGKPVESSVNSVTLKISLIVDTSGTISGQTLTSLYDDIDTIRGKWNNATFLNWSSNQLLCTAADVSPIRDEYYRASYSFLWDEWKLCDQKPNLDIDGFPAMNTNRQVKDVYWASRQRGSTDFNGIFDTQPNTTIAKQMAKEGSYLTYP